MSDREAITLDPAVARGRMARRATRIAKCISELDTAIKDKDLEAVEMGWLEAVEMGWIQDMNDTTENTITNWQKQWQIKKSMKTRLLKMKTQ